MKIEYLDNGLAVIVDHIPYLESVSYSLIMPGGIIYDSDQTQGNSLVLAELLGKGAGKYDSFGLISAFDEHGIRHSESADLESISLRGSLLGDKLEIALQLVSMMVEQPKLPENEIASITSLLEQDLVSLQDNPARRVHLELAKRYYPAPYNRSSYGELAGIKNCNSNSIQEAWSKSFRPKGSVFSIAGKLDEDHTINLVKKYFSNWQGQAPSRPNFGTIASGQMHHIDFKSAQLQIALAYKAAAFGDPLYYTAKIVNQILSGGMFGRLFIEVREKRGLVYSVYSSHSATMYRGTFTAYAGTTPERAQETLDVMLNELKNVGKNLSKEEISRAKANLKSSLIMSEESAGSRAATSASDWWLTGKVRSLDKIKNEIEKVTVEDIEKYTATFPLTDMTVVTLGERALKI